MGKEISIENGFHIVMIFLEPFLWNFIKIRMIEKKLILSEKMTPQELKSASEIEKIKDDLYDDNGFFFLTVCNGSSSDKYFEEVIEKRLGVPPLKQHSGLKVEGTTLFQLTIDFCEYFNKRFQKEGRDSLRFAIDWLEDMRKHPEKHKEEWEIWDKVVVGVTEHGEKSIGFF